ncbi:ABC transporter substrate-binding protein [Tenacibaculum discolor]|uniref:ABC transporter substrate-binding protein n=1 Tax=Tenacibaculum discolor TaxID=361581 RepID=UPI000EB0CC15|nr:ABC transporter substrate-binding protein [Tenacibaculum discolor]RLK02483.1 iron complex transport system substrate-binding protein [Tenacibaculum discolor]
MKRYLLIFSLLLLFTQCKQETKKTTEKKTSQSTVKYAKGFDIISENGAKKLIIKKAFQSSHEYFSYTLSNKTNLSKNEIKVPVEKMVITSTTHVPMLELLNAENTIVGFPHTKYVSSKRTRNRIDEGFIVELGLEQDMNTEKLIDIEPELVVGFALHPNTKLYQNIKKTGIPVIFNGDWLEETPLGRAEWIKFFGALYGKEKEADSIFTNIETEYLKAKEIAKNSAKQPTILSGSMFKDVWNVPAGESFIATFYNDANLNYLWKETKGTGSLPLSFESVLEKGQHADFWFNCGLYATKEQLTTANIHYKEFDAFTNNKIFSIGHNKGETGGLIYFELSPVRPDLVLKDLIKITHPNLLPEYELTFYKEVE